MRERKFSALADERLLKRGNKILEDLFRRSVHSIRQLTDNDSDAKGVYRFLQNSRVSEQDIVDNLVSNCKAACDGKYVLCIQDTTEINLSSHGRRIKRDDFIGTTNAKNDKGLGFFLHPSLVLDAQSGVPYGYSDIKIWNRPLVFKTKHEREYDKLSITEKESYKWIEVSKNTQKALSDTVKSMVIIQDREGDIYEQFATIPDAKTSLLIRAKTDRSLSDGSKLFSCLSHQQAQCAYTVEVPAKGGRKQRSANIEIRYRAVKITKPRSANKDLAPSVNLYLVEAKEVAPKNTDGICWRLLTTIPIEDAQMALLCVEWYSWRWTIEEIFKILKKEGYNIEASE